MKYVKQIRWTPKNQKIVDFLFFVVVIAHKLGVEKFSIRFEIMPEDESNMFKYAPGVAECDDCGEVIDWLFHVNDELWNEFAGKKEILHAKCFEKRMARKLKLSDFTNALVNHSIFFGHDMASRER